MNGINRGYGIFGKEYEIMLRNDLHAEQSIDHVLMKEMILVNEDSCGLLYGSVPVRVDMSDHELYLFALQFQKETIQDTIDCILQYTSNIANDFQEPFESMQFGGTEKEILNKDQSVSINVIDKSIKFIVDKRIKEKYFHEVYYGT